MLVCVVTLLKWPPREASPRMPWQMGAEDGVARTLWNLWNVTHPPGG